MKCKARHRQGYLRSRECRYNCVKVLLMLSCGPYKVMQTRTVSELHQSTCFLGHEELYLGLVSRELLSEVQAIRLQGVLAFEVIVPRNAVCIL